MQLQEISQSELQGVEGGYTNNSPFSTKNPVFDGIIIGGAFGSAFGGVGAVVGGIIGGLLGLFGL
jgi:hypothetical protein